MHGVQDCSFLDPSVDLVSLLNLGADPPPPGITRSTGMCEAREGKEASADVAYKITDRAVASVPTAQVFTGE